MHMATYTIYRERIPSTDPRLKRHILHDDRSRLYPFDTRGLALQEFHHEETIPVFDQGQVGSCTADAAFGTLGTAPYYSGVLAQKVAERWGGLNQAGAYRFYSDEENLDGDGPYPPQDNGSTGLTSAKVLRDAGIIAGWTQTFTVEDALMAGSQQPVSCGTYWYNSMFTPDDKGVITIDPSSGIAGGHQYVMVGYDPATGLIEFRNSWGSGWGDGGHFYAREDSWGTLLENQGDVTVFTIPGDPQPQPVPPDAATAALVAALRHNNWAFHHHIGDSARVAHAGQAWLIDNGQ
jgi:hypothetical protein